MTESKVISGKYTTRVFARLRGPLFAVVENLQDYQSGSMPDLGEYHGPIDQTVLVPVSDGKSVFVAPIHDDERARPGSPLMVWFDVEADKPATGLPPEAEIYLDELSDQLGFFWNYPVTIYDLSLVDVTLPAGVGDVRNTMIIAGYNLPKHRRSNFKLQDQHIGEPNFFEMHEPVRAALRWHSAASINQPDAQRFVALWIALEILARHKVAVTSAPYVAPCGHTIATCPECERSTEKSVEGKRMKSFLIDHLGATKADADMLWDVRQLVHGRHRFRPKDIEKMPRATGLLWTIVRRALGTELGLTYEGDPVAPLAFSWMAMSGTCVLSDGDLNPGTWTQPARAKPSIRIEL
jgi:hypothetical protein